MRRLLLPLLVIVLGVVFLLRVIPAVGEDAGSQVYFPIIKRKTSYPLATGHWAMTQISGPGSTNSAASFDIKIAITQPVLFNFDFYSPEIFRYVSGQRCTITSEITIPLYLVNPGPPPQYRYALSELDLQKADTGSTCKGIPLHFTFRTNVMAKGGYVTNCLISPSYCDEGFFTFELQEP